MGCFRMQRIRTERRRVSVPLRGVGCFKKKIKHFRTVSSFRPLSGCKVFQMKVYKGTGKDMFSSPCEVWVVSCNPRSAGYCDFFPSPCGVWVVSRKRQRPAVLRAVSVPLRGVDCFHFFDIIWRHYYVSVPLRGVGCFGAPSRDRQKARVSVPLRGVGCFKVDHGQDYTSLAFPSPCGVWVVSLADSINYHIDSVSVPLRGVGCFGKSAHSF